MRQGFVLCNQDRVAQGWGIDCSSLDDTLCIFSRSRSVGSPFHPSSYLYQATDLIIFVAAVHYLLVVCSNIPFLPPPFVGECFTLERNYLLRNKRSNGCLRVSGESVGMDWGNFVLIGARKSSSAEPTGLMICITGASGFSWYVTVVLILTIVLPNLRSYRPSRLFPARFCALSKTPFGFKAIHK